MKKIVLFLSMLYLLGCSKNELTPQEAQVIGSWQLVEFCISPGFGNCTPQTTTTVQTQTLEFKKNGTFIQKIPEPGKFQTPIVSSGEFKIGAPGKISLTFDDQATHSGTVQWTYELSSNQLTIHPQCFEGCSYTYQRM